MKINAAAPVNAVIRRTPTAPAPAVEAQQAPQDVAQISAPKTRAPQAATLSQQSAAVQTAGAAIGGAVGAALLTLPDGSTRPYPVAPKSEQKDTYCGITVADPYRPLEEQNSPTVKQWVADQNNLTRSFLDQLPGREKIQAAVLKAVHTDVKSLPVITDDSFFYLKSADGFARGTLMRSDLNGKNETPIFDPNTLSSEGLVNINDYEPSPDGKKIALGLVENGTDWVKWQIRDLKTGEVLPGEVNASKFGDGFQWADDSKGFYYGRYDRPVGDAELVDADKRLGMYFHKLGTPESTDVAAEPASVARTRDLAAVLPESKDALQNVIQVKDQIIAHYLEDGHSRLEKFDLQGKSLGAIPLPQIGAIYDLRASKDEAVFDFSGPAYPPTVMSFKPGEDKAEIMWQAKASYNPADYETTLDFSTSPDGTKVPIYITRRKDTPMHDQRPTYLYGYGGFDCPEYPDNKSNLNIIPFLDMGGIFVDTCLRGGNEYGENWHQDGMLLNKQNVFTDYESVGDYLMQQKICGPGKLAAGGRSNGGLLAAATELQRPDLFAAVIPEVGVMDLMRFPKFTCGYQWVSEYGSVNKPDDVKNMLKYSPINNVVEGRKYPSTMIMTADHDDRVPPGDHSYKQAALLQQAQGADKPVLLRVEHNAGHGSFDHPWPTNKLVSQDTDRWTFLANALGMQTA